LEVFGRGIPTNIRSSHRITMLIMSEFINRTDSDSKEPDWQAL
jgi:hypothetical protein